MQGSLYYFFAEIVTITSFVTRRETPRSVARPVVLRTMPGVLKRRSQDPFFPVFLSEYPFLKISGCLSNFHCINFIVNNLKGVLSDYQTTIRAVGSRNER